MRLPLNRRNIPQAFLASVISIGAGTALSAQQVAIRNLEWLTGCWEINQGSRQVVERWSAPKDGIMSGSSRTLIGGEPRESEQLRLFVRGDSLIYEAIPSGQRLTEFAARTMTTREVVFENPAHDFPQRIIYSRVGADSLIARIEGNRGGRLSAVSYPYRKTECRADTPTAGETARAQLEPFYRDLQSREEASGSGTNAWMAANAAPGFVFLTWTVTGLQPGIAGAETLRRAVEASSQGAASQAIRDRTYAHTVERLFARGDSASVLVTQQRVWKFPDAAGRFGTAGAYHERRATEKRIDRWLRTGGVWRLHESAMIGSDVYIDGKLYTRDGKIVQ